MNIEEERDEILDAFVTHKEGGDWYRVNTYTMESLLRMCMEKKFHSIYLVDKKLRFDNFNCRWEPLEADARPG